MAQPQKRNTIRKLMDAATIRLCELNEELREIDISEYHYVDGELIELKLVPYDVEIIHPALMYPRPIDIEDMWRKLKSGEKIYVPPPPPPPPPEEPAEGEGKVDENVPGASQEGGGEVKEGDETKGTEQATEASGGAEGGGTEKGGAEGEAAVSESEAQKKKEKKTKKAERPKETPQFGVEEKELTQEELEEIQKKKVLTEMVKLIQSAERGRQERLYYAEKSYTVIQSKRLAADPTLKPPEPPKADVAKAAALQIQKVWRGHAAREWVRQKEDQRRLLIGMSEPSWRSKEEFEKLEKHLNKRRSYRDERIREYVETIDSEKARILRVVAPGLMEDIGDEIREWFHEFYDRIKLFPPFPTEEEGGTVLVVRGSRKKKREKEKSKGKDKKAEKEKRKKEKLKAKQDAKKQKEAEKKLKAAEALRKKKMKEKGEYEYDYLDTISAPLYNEGIKEHMEIWDQIDDFENPLEKPYTYMITDQECYETQLEVRKQVDELMRIELDLLQYALEVDKMRAKGKKGKPKQKKKKKPKKKKGKKGKKDPTGNRTTEDLFQELFDNGIIRTYPTVRLTEYQGDFSFKNYELRNMEFDPPATLLDVRQAVILNCIMPLGVQTMKKPKSVLIAGPRQSGKHLLANAIFTETKCVLFDLSPENTANKYMGAKGMKLLIHLISKMSRILAPSIIYFDAAEKIFYKKVPKDERQLDPKRIGKKLFKGIVKTITPEDRVLVLGITKQPWAAQAAKLKKAFERNILIPRPDYGSVYLYWQQLLMSYHGVDRNFNLTCLATVTLNYPLPDIKKAVEKILTPRRLIQLKYKPLQPDEIFEVFVSEGIEPITEKEYLKFLKWYNKTPLGKDRVIFNKNAEIKREAERKKKEKEDSKKK
ncbi:hypothetical protein NQ318_010418 [Aromia moschata]|uniref:ATPase AAA-type core domain-containing protein n=1 Tax=Aromia moschata TaxID=1265417 RepID=A0AAV8XLW1_9CUCU|nr:hypothetical protein NQ318_010418 [Aromia moschata]